jgi:hypothetical protein
MLQRILGWFANFFTENQEEIARHSPTTRRAVLLCRIVARRARQFAVSHFVLTSLFFATAIASFVYFNPTALFAQKCHFVSKAYDEVVRTGEERPCQTGKPIALTWSNTLPGGPTNGGMLVNMAALYPSGDVAVWLEDYIEAKRPPEDTPFQTKHRWKFASEKYLLFEPGGCGFDATKVASREIRIGMVIVTTEPRPLNKTLTQERRLQCFSADPQDPLFADCGWANLELFIPTVQPFNTCPKRTLSEIWAGELTTNRPTKAPLCIHGVGLDGSFMADRPWQVFSPNIDTVWCD